jgi:hypothetical protein
VLSQWPNAREPVLIRVSLALLKERGIICTVIGAGKGMPYRLPWQGLLSCELLSTSATGVWHCTEPYLIIYQITLGEQGQSSNAHYYAPFLIIWLKKTANLRNISNEKNKKNHEAHL